MKLPFALWTGEAVPDLIAHRCGVRLSVWTVGRYLRCGFKPGKPLRRAYERDPVAVRRRVRKQYPPSGPWRGRSRRSSTGATRRGCGLTTKRGGRGVGEATDRWSLAQGSGFGES